MISAPIKVQLNETLRQLVMQARKGDQEAYRRLLSELAPIIRRNVSARIGKWGQQHYTEDVTQEALLSIHLKLHTYDASQPFLAWVNAVARHKLIDHLRKIKGISISLDDEDLPELVDSVNPEAGTIIRDLHKLLDRLKPPAGDIIYGMKVEGASVRELAQSFKTSESNIKVIVHRGLQKLSEMITADAS